MKQDVRLPSLYVRLVPSLATTLLGLSTSAHAQCTESFVINEQGFGAVWYVDAHNSSPGLGDSWPSAFDDLEDALVEARASQGTDLIKVAQGEYTPSALPPGATDPRAVTFLIDAGANAFSNTRRVVIAGGYRGCPDGSCDPGDPDPNDRDPTQFFSILSGKLANPCPPPCGEGAPCFLPSNAPGCADTSCCCLICGLDPACCDPELGWDENCVDAAIEECPPNAYHVVTFDGTDPGEDITLTSRIDGFTITQGHASGPGAFEDTGGGMLINDASPMIVNCAFEGSLAQGNKARKGGAMGLTTGAASAPLILNCVFRGNVATANGGGGAVYVPGGAGGGNRPRFVNCTFVNNESRVDEGGAISAPKSNGTEITNCTFYGNVAGGQTRL